MSVSTEPIETIERERSNTSVDVGGSALAETVDAEAPSSTYTIRPKFEKK